MSYYHHKHKVTSKQKESETKICCIIWVSHWLTLVTWNSSSAMVWYCVWMCLNHNHVVINIRPFPRRNEASPFFVPLRGLDFLHKLTNCLNFAKENTKQILFLVWYFITLLYLVSLQFYNFINFMSFIFLHFTKGISLFYIIIFMSHNLP